MNNSSSSHTIINHSTSAVPRLTVVGAGPGDPELITLKALKALQEADVILYDALANQELLCYCRPEALQMYVGKRRGAASVSQEEINERIVECARLYGHVVRLKGGDPFVFGRGFEELLHAEQHGVQTAYIPGISSAVAVPGLAGVPLTHRGTSESFWVITGSRANGSVSHELHAAARSTATVVVLMGLEALPMIVAVFVEHGKRALPIAVISQGSLPTTRTVSGTVETILDIVQQAQLSTPAVIVLGEVVGLQRRKAQAMLPC